MPYFSNSTLPQPKLGLSAGLVNYSPRWKADMPSVRMQIAGLFDRGRKSPSGIAVRLRGRAPEAKVSGGKLLGAMRYNSAGRRDVP
jgi:hypothetical protein